MWNRLRFKDPDTGKRVSRLNPETQWVIQEVPELRIVDQETWDAVKAQQQALAYESSAPGENKLYDCRRPRYLFAGLVKCGCRGGGYTMISKDLLGCATARNKGTCTRVEEHARAELGPPRAAISSPRELCSPNQLQEKIQAKAQFLIGGKSAEVISVYEMCEAMGLKVLRMDARRRIFKDFFGGGVGASLRRVDLSDREPREEMGGGGFLRCPHTCSSFRNSGEKQRVNFLK
ncbi:recombinase family protein [Bradyrhizobium sp. CCGB12]|uniref:recombinase family protein n=1 Tax=Bradyrhizobium sp. CCGB12 TaxID=2949632 RepID=UPI0020B22242|nr:recombinase family protein [Bradyrhizobium sp. CCGB12]MCP3392088.1 recombinase family protein [Bradyrhizobium sp. CCGB12]